MIQFHNRVTQTPNVTFQLLYNNQMTHTPRNSKGQEIVWDTNCHNPSNTLKNSRVAVIVMLYCDLIELEVGT